MQVILCAEAKESLDLINKKLKNQKNSHGFENLRIYYDV